MKRIYTLAFLTVALLVSSRMLYAQQTVFNVPSPAVLEAKKVYLENDWYFRSWETSSGKAGTTYVRGVLGIGWNIEVGLNAGAFDLLQKSDPFLDIAVKWAPINKEFAWKGDKEEKGNIIVYIGNNIGIDLRNNMDTVDDPIGNEDDNKYFLYGAVGLIIPKVGTILSAGGYYATTRVFSEDSPGGVLATLQQPISFINGLMVAADFFSGTGAYFTPGLIYSIGPASFYAGYGFANNGRSDDLVTLEYGLLF